MDACAIDGIADFYGLRHPSSLLLPVGLDPPRHPLPTGRGSALPRRQPYSPARRASLPLFSHHIHRDSCRRSRHCLLVAHRRAIQSYGRWDFISRHRRRRCADTVVGGTVGVFDFGSGLLGWMGRWGLLQVAKLSDGLAEF
jgi:hypothetical protein